MTDHKLKLLHFSFPCVCPSVSDSSVAQYVLRLFILWSWLCGHQKKCRYIQFCGM